MKEACYQSASRRYYKASATRTPVLIVLLIITIALFGFTELAIRRIPAHEGFGKIGNAVTDALDKRALLKRASVSAPPPSPIAPVASASVVQNESPKGGSSGGTSTALGIDGPYLTPGKTVTSPPVVYSTIATSGPYLEVGNGKSPTTPPSVPPKTTPTVPPEIRPIVSTAPRIMPGDGEKTTKPTEPPIIASTPANDVPYLTPGVPTGTPGPVTQSTGGGGYLKPGPGTSTVVATAPDAYLLPGGGSRIVPGSGTKPMTGYSETPIAGGGRVDPNAGGSKPSGLAAPNTPNGPNLQLGVNPVNPVTPLPTPTGTNPYLVPVMTPGKEAAMETVEALQGTASDNRPVVTTGAVPTVLPNPTQGSPVLTVFNGQTFAVTPTPTFINGVTYTQTPVLTVVDGKTMAITPGINVVDGKTFTQTPVFTVVDGNTYAVTPYVTVSDGKTYTTTPGLSLSPTATRNGPFLENDPTNAASRPTATIVNSTGTYYAYSNGESYLAPQITLREYILVAFVPLIVAVLYTIPWRILDVTIREMEPFYQLNQREGALGKNSLCLDYSTSWLITTPFKAISRGHIMPFWSSLISIAVLILAPISSEAFFVSVDGECGAASKVPCRAAWGVYPILGRAIQGILAFIAILLILIAIFNYRRSSGVYSEPLSLAGLAVLLAKSPLLRCLRQIDSMVTNRELREIIQGKRFALSSFVAEDLTRCHGIVPMDMDSEVGFASVGSIKEKKGAYTSVHTVDEFGIGEYEMIRAPNRGMINWHSGMSFWKDVKEKSLLFGAFLVVGGLLTIITYYHWTGPDPVTGKTTGFETFMDSQGFGVRFMMTALGVVIKLLWSNVDEDLRRTTPFTSLIRGSSIPNDSILVPFHGSPTTAILPSLKRKHFIVAWVAFLSFLSEFLPIFLANIPYSPAMTKDAYTYCHFLSMAILILMTLALLVLLFKKPGGVGSLPRRPGKGGVVSTALYLAAPSEADSTFSNVFGRESERERGLLDCLAGLSTVGGRERNDAIVGVGSLYSLGVVDGGGDERSSIGGRRRSAGELREELRIDDDRRVRRLLCE